MVEGRRGQGAGEGDFGCLMFNFAPRSRDTLTRGFLIEKRLLTLSPDAGRGRVAKDGKGAQKRGIKGLRDLGWEGF